jgi:hypothetical protein
MRPQVGDLIIRNLAAYRCEIVKAVTGDPVAGPFPSFADAFQDACARAPRYIWHQSTDTHGRTQGDPIMVKQFHNPQ